MKSAHQEPCRSAIRRKDREVKDATWICAFLQKAPYGVLGTASADQPFVTSTLFVFDETKRVLYLHSALTGRTRSNVEGNPRVCFTVSEMGRLLPAAVALDFSVEYASVVVFGHGTVVNSAEESEYALQKLLDKYFPHLKSSRDYRPITAEEVSRTSVFKISIEEWSAKRKSAESEYPGAFLYPLLS